MHATMYRDPRASALILILYEPAHSTRHSDRPLLSERLKRRCTQMIRPSNSLSWEASVGQPGCDHRTAAGGPQDGVAVHRCAVTATLRSGPSNECLTSVR